MILPDCLHTATPYHAINEVMLCHVCWTKITTTAKQKSPRPRRAAWGRAATVEPRRGIPTINAETTEEL